MLERDNPFRIHNGKDWIRQRSIKDAKPKGNFDSKRLPTDYLLTAREEKISLQWKNQMVTKANITSGVRWPPSASRCCHLRTTLIPNAQPHPNDEERADKGNECCVPQTGVILITGDWNAKVGSQEVPGVTHKFGLGVQNEAGQRLTEFCQRTHCSSQTPSSNNTRDDSTHGHHQMVNTEIRLTIFFAAEDREALYSQQKQDWELTMAQIMNPLLPNSD